MPKPVHMLARETSSSERDAGERDASGVTGASIESVPKRTRRKFSASEKLRILKAAEAAVRSVQRGALEALLRKEGIYSSHLASWREQLGARGSAGLEPRKPGRKPALDAKDKELAAMRKKLAKLEHEMRIAKGLIELQKKAHAILGIALPTFDESSVLDDEESS